jgi:tight adherence protein B
MDMVSGSLLIAGLMSATGFVYALFWLWSDFSHRGSRSITDRLTDLERRTGRTPELYLLKRRVFSHRPWLERHLSQWPALHRFDRFLLQTGWKIRVETALMSMALTVVGMVCITAVLGLPWMGVPLLTGLAALGGLALLQYHRRRRRNLIESQLPEVLDLIARAMQAGHALSSAILLASREGPQPLAHEMRTIFDEINFGIQTRVAIEDFANRVGSEYTRLFVVSALVQMETGGNMADILRNTATLIRQRQQMKASVKVLSAEARVSAVILSTLPFALAGFMLIINPGFISVLWVHPMGVKLLLGSGVLMVLGVVWMWRLIDISV